MRRDLRRTPLAAVFLPAEDESIKCRCKTPLGESRAEGQRNDDEPERTEAAARERRPPRQQVEIPVRDDIVPLIPLHEEHSDNIAAHGTPPAGIQKDCGSSFQILVRIPRTRDGGNFTSPSQRARGRRGGRVSRLAWALNLPATSARMFSGDWDGGSRPMSR